MLAKKSISVADICKLTDAITGKIVTSNDFVLASNMIKTIKETTPQPTETNGGFVEMETLEFIKRSRQIRVKLMTVAGDSKFSKELLEEFDDLLEMVTVLKHTERAKKPSYSLSSSDDYEDDVPPGMPFVRFEKMRDCAKMPTRFPGPGIVFRLYAAEDLKRGGHCHFIIDTGIIATFAKGYCGHTTIHRRDIQSVFHGDMSDKYPICKGIYAEPGEELRVHVTVEKERRISKGQCIGALVVETQPV